jgi:hypothetical protein
MIPNFSKSSRFYFLEEKLCFDYLNTRLHIYFPVNYTKMFERIEDSFFGNKSGICIIVIPTLENRSDYSFGITIFYGTHITGSLVHLWPSSYDILYSEYFHVGICSRIIIVLECKRSTF